MSKNTNLHKARKEKNDEFYTLLKDIEAELQHYTDHLKGQIIYCPCDDENSNFWLYFLHNFSTLGIKKVIATHISRGEPAYKIETEDGKLITKTFLEGDGDFASEECCKIRDEADIIITNPPFSKFIKFVEWLT